MRKKTLAELMRERSNNNADTSAYTDKPMQKSANTKTNTVQELVNNVYQKKEDSSLWNKIEKRANAILSDAGKSISNFGLGAISSGKDALYYIESMSNKGFKSYKKQNQFLSRIKENQENYKKLTDDIISTHNINKDIRNKENLVETRKNILLPQKKYESPIQNILSKSINKDEEKIQKNIENTQTKVGKKMSELMPSIGQSVSGMVASAVNPALGFSYFQTSAGGTYTREAKSKGMNDNQSILYGTIMGSMESATESLGNKLTTRVGKTFFKNSAKEGIKALGLDIGENFLEEAIMEPIQEVVTSVSGGEADWNNIGSRMLKSGIDGALTSIIMGGASAGIGKATKLISKMQNGEKISQNEIKDTLQEVQKSNKVDIENIILENIDKTAQNELLTIQNNGILNNNQQIIQENNKMSQNGFSEQIDGNKQNNQNINYNRQENLQNYQNTAQKYNIDLNNDTVKAIFGTADRREIKVSYDDTIFTNSNQNAIWRQNEDGTREILINPEADTQKALQSIQVHELTHDMEGTKEYDALSKVVLNKMKTQEGYQEAINNLSDMYSKVYDKNSSDFNSLVEQEAVADFLGENLGNQEFLNELVNSQPRNTIQKIYDWIVDKINKLTGYNTEKLYWQDVKTKFENAFNSEFNNENQNSKYSILTNSKNQKYVKADRQVITGNNPIKWEQQVENYINDNIRKNKDVQVFTEEGDILTITKDTAGKAKFRNEVVDKNGNKRRLNNKEFSAKLRAEIHIDELAKVSKHKNGPVPDTKNHSFANDGFTYRTAYFEDLDGQYYKITMSVGKNGNINTIYNVGKMQKNRRYSISELKGSSGKSTSDRISSTNSIPNSDVNVNNGNTTKYSIQENEKNTEKWQEFLNKHSINKGTKTTINDVRLPISENRFQDVINNAKYIPNDEKANLLKDIETISKTTKSLKEFQEFVESENNTYKQLDDEKLNTNVTYNTGRKEVYQKYLNSTNKYDTNSLENAKNIIPANSQGRRTKSQWLNVAKQIGTEIANKSNTEIEEIAYRTWQDERPSSKESLNRQGEKYVEFTSDEWINTIYNSVKEQREKFSISGKASKDIENNSNLQYNNTESESDISYEKRYSSNVGRRVQKLLENYRRGQIAKENSNGIIQKIPTQEEIKKAIIDFANTYSKKNLNSKEKNILNMYKKLNGNVIFYEYGKDNIDIGLTDKNTVYIDTLTEENIDNIAYHELAHFLRKNSNKEYLNNIKPIIDKIANNFDEQEIIYNYAMSSSENFEIGMLDGNHQEILAEEVIGDTIANLYGDLEVDYGLDLNDIQTIKNTIDRLLKKNSMKSSFLVPQSNEEKIDLLPKKKIESPETKQRKHYKSIMQSSETSAEAKKIAKELLGSDTYVPDSNRAQIERADQRISSNPDNELNALTSKIDNGDRLNATDIAVSERLIEYYSKIGDKEKLQTAIQNTALAGTQLGQSVQALSLINRQTPIGQVTYIERSIKKLNKEILDRKGYIQNEDGKILDRKGQDITEKVELFNFTSEMQEKILNSNKDNLNSVLDEIYKELGNQVSKSTQQKIDSWRYFAMLGNVKTHGRNIIGNIGMGKTQRVKDKIAGGIEDIAGILNPNMERTKTLRKTNKVTKEFAKNDIKNVATELGLDSNKYTAQNRLQDNMREFKSDILNNTIGKIYEINNTSLEVEDGWGLKSAYVKAFGDYITANRLDVNNISDKNLRKARKYAIDQAQEATFHQANAIASAINQFSKTKGKFITDAILPFVKTPLNVAKAGIEYNPAGLVYNSIKGIHDLNTGKITVNKYIDNISKGLTGTGIALIGYALAEAGVIKASGGDDDKEKYDQERGNQAYSVKIGDNTYTLDWLAPIGIPLFVGVEAHEIIKAKKEEKTSTSTDDDTIYKQGLESATNILNAFTTSMNPMAEMSMISGLTSALRSYDSDTANMLASMGSNMATSYINQFVPTLLGQVARVTDNKERTTTSTATGIFSKAVDQTKNQMMSKIPGLRQQLPVATDIWGQEKDNDEKIVRRAFETFIAPYTRKNVETVKVDTELNDLFDRTGDASIYPDKINKKITINGSDYRLTNEEFIKYSKEYGQNSFNLINSLCSLSDYKGLTDEEKQKAISNIYSYSKEVNKVNYSKKVNTEFETSDLYNVMNKISSNAEKSKYLIYLSEMSGNDIKDKDKKSYILNSTMKDSTKEIIYKTSLGKKDELYQILYDIDKVNINAYLDYSIQEIKADEDKNSDIEGKTISGSKKNNLINYLNNSNLSIFDKLYIYGKYYILDSKERAIVDNGIENSRLSTEEKLEAKRKLFSSNIIKYKDGTVEWK